MSFYTFHTDGFSKPSVEFIADVKDVERAAFETALEVSQCLGHLVFVTVRDSIGTLVCVAPRLPSANDSRVAPTPSPAQ